MKIALFGATGRIGKEMLSLLLENNDEITALVRTPTKLQTHPNLTLLQGDARVFSDVEKTLAGADAVISALGTDKTTVLTESVEHIISIMEKQKIKRVVTIGTAGILTSRVNPNLLRYESSESKRKSIIAAKEHLNVYEMLKRSALDWTIVCPTYLPTGDATKAYIIERNQLPLGAVKSTTGDTALYAFKELFENKHIGYRVGIMSPN
ncbi:NAD(P)-dependent oxidoreductase [Psychrobacillus sp. L3]|uniref:NAD(P)-dependent oxidoreductase n=1 Tax=Psychrobacillus sp. L3 TaxID=3236891 RepID=UPI0036F2A09F